MVYLFINMHYTMDVLLFIFHGFLGGLLWLLVKWKWEKRAVIQHTIVSMICGYIYYILHQEYNLPNSVATIVAGYFSVDFIQTLMDKYHKLMHR